MRLGITALVCAALSLPASGADYSGEVRFGDQPVPGATVTLVNARSKLAVSTDATGHFEFKSVATEDGPLTLTVEMQCFAAVSREVTSAQPIVLHLELLPETTPCSEPIAPTITAPQAPVPQSPTTELRERPLAGYLISGSVDNANDSVLAQPAAFGNFSRGTSTYYASLLATLDTSALDAAPYSLTGSSARPPAHTLAGGVVTLSGPIDGRRQAQPGKTAYFTLSYEWARNRFASVVDGRVPTAAERAGDFSSTRVAVIDPLSGAAFPGGIFPSSRISRQATALLGLFPQAATASAAGYNIEAPVIRGLHRDAVRALIAKPIGPGHLSAEFTTESVRADESTLFGFLDRKQTGGTRASLAFVPGRPAAWQGRFALTLDRHLEKTLPFFAGVRDIEGEAGIQGAAPRSSDWGPPSLYFSSGVSGLNDVGAFRLQTQSVGLSAAESGSFRSWQVRTGFNFARRERNQLGVADARGTFGFTGAATGIDWADFLLGMPATASLATGPADRYLRANDWAAFLLTEWRPSAGLTVNAGARWEYASPYAERYRRLANLDVTNGFATATVATASPRDSTLVRPFRAMIEPRVSLAWLPFIGSSLVVRAGYGIYADAGVYESLASSLAAQPPFGRNFAIENSVGAPRLTLANALTAPGAAFGTFGVDARFRPGNAQNWQVALERDLAWGLLAKVTYLGIKGTHAQQAIYPNTYPAGGVAQCPACPSGFAYFLSGGNSSRHAGQLELRRRMRGGWAVKSQTTWAKAIDNAALGGATGGGGAQLALVAQNWANLAAERARSNFDQRFTERVTAEYTFRFTSGWRHRLFDEWRLASDLTLATGLPLTPIDPRPIGGTGFIGSLRPDYTGAPLYDAPPGLHLNPAAFATPAAGQWGNAGRNTITGPGQLSLNSSLWRTLRLGDRTNVDLRLDATNPLNHPTFTRWDTTLNSVLFGLPAAANAMRSLKFSIEVRY